MPIDTSLYGKFAPPPRESPFTQLSQLVNAQTAMGQLRQQQQQQADQAAIRQVLTETGGNIKEALPRLRTIAPAAALDFESKIAEQQKHAWDALKSQTETEAKQLQVGLQILPGVHDERTFQIARRRLAAIDPDVADLLGETFDPARRDQVLQLGLTAKEALDTRREGLKAFNTGEAGRGLATFLSTAQHQQDWDAGLAAARAAGVPDTVIAQFGPQFSPEAKARAAELGITPEKRVELAGSAATRAQTERHQTVLEQQGAERGAQGAERGASARRNAQPAAASGPLPPRVETTVRGLASRFSAEPSVKRTVTMAEAVSFIKGLDVQTKNPADDQALIYAFAKAMDPESVVREGE